MDKNSREGVWSLKPRKVRMRSPLLSQQTPALFVLCSRWPGSLLPGCPAHVPGVFRAGWPRRCRKTFLESGNDVSRGWTLVWEALNGF